MADSEVAVVVDGSPTDLDKIQSLEAFAEACDRLRAGRSYADIRRAARPRGLAQSTLSDLLNAKSTPNRDTVITFFSACGLDQESQRPWLAAWERVAYSHQPRPAGAVRVREARPRLLGVQAAIQVPGTRDELPPYVPRDLDADLRAAIEAAAAQGGFVLLVGGSSVGKTRTLYEMMRATLPEWWLLHPTDTAAIATHAASPTPRTVLWLDELQRYLNQDGGRLVGAVRHLIAGGTVVAATLWPDEYNMRTARPAAGVPDPHADGRDLLRLARTQRVPDLLTTVERRRGETLAATDQRIRIALGSSDAGFTQVISAGPALIDRWEQAPDCYGKAVITAALDARRVGAQHPASRDLLAEAAPAYLTPAQIATAPPDWLDRALAYATTAVHGAASCLTAVATGMGQVAGYTSADYLYQHARRARRTLVVPDQLWLALVVHRHSDDTLGLGDNADRRGHPGHAITLYRLAVDADCRYPGDVALRPAVKLAWLLSEQGDVGQALEVLRAHADAGDKFASIELAGLLGHHGHADELRARAGAGDDYAAFRLAGLLSDNGETGQAIEVLRPHAGAEGHSAAVRLAELMADQGDVEQALELLRPLADADSPYAARRLAELLAARGEIDQALQVLRRHADRAGEGHDSNANILLAGLLAAHDRVDELVERADAGNVIAAQRLADLLVGHGRTDDLRARADAGDRIAARQLALVLAGQGRAGELSARVDAGDREAFVPLIDLLVDNGDLDEALGRLRARAAAGSVPAAIRLAELLADQGDVEQSLQLLRPLADIGDSAVDRKLAVLLADHGRVDELRTRADADDHDAAMRLAELLAEQGDLEQAMELLRAQMDLGFIFTPAALAEIAGRAETHQRGGTHGGTRWREDG